MKVFRVRSPTGEIHYMKAAGFLYVTKSRDNYVKESGHWQRTYDFRYYEEV